MKTNPDQSNKTRSVRPPVRVVKPPLPERPDVSAGGRQRYYFLFTMILGMILYLVLQRSGMIDTLFAHLSSWQRQAMTESLRLALIFVLPLIIHLLLSPRDLDGITLTNRNGSWISLSLVAFLAGFPLAVVAGSLQTVLALLLSAAGADHTVWLIDPAMPAYHLNVVPQRIAYILIICVIPACLSEIALRGIHYAQLIRRNRYLTALLCAAAATPLFMLQQRLFPAYLISGLFACFLYNQSQSVLPPIAAQISFNLMYRWLIHRDGFLRLFPTTSLKLQLEMLVPGVLKGLLAACLFVPLFVLAAQLNKRNPLTDSAEILRSHRRRNKHLSSYGKALLPAMIVLAVLYLIFAKV